MSGKANGKTKWQDPKIKQAERTVNRLYSDLQKASARYLRLIKPTELELKSEPGELWAHIKEDVGAKDLVHWNALLADAILFKRRVTEELNEPR